jgi:hypothetical protein
VCNHKELTRFPYKQCEISYGEIRDQTTETGNSTESSIEEEIAEGEDNESFCSAKAIDEPASRDVNREPSDLFEQSGRKGFFLVYKNGDDKLYEKLGDQQRRDIRRTIEKMVIQHKTILQNFKDIVKKIRHVKKTLPDTDPKYKLAIADAKRELRLFKDPYEEDNEGNGSRKRRRKSVENQTRYSDSKITYFSETNETMKEEELTGLRQSWEKVYKEIWNKHLLIPKNPVIHITVPQVTAMVRDMENDVNQLLADCAGMVEDV